MSRFSSRTSWDTSESRYAATVREARAAGPDAHSVELDTHALEPDAHASGLDVNKAARPLFDLTLSNPTRCGFNYDAETLLAPLTDVRALVYDPDPRGLSSARQAVAGYYAAHGAEVSPDDLLLTTSTSESYSFLFRLLCDAGDEVLVAEPSYPLFDFLADLDDVHLRPYPLYCDHGWWADFSELERAITPRTRAVVVVHPNNPTGHWTAASERQRLEEICVRHGLALIVDEVFLDYPLRETSSPPSSFACGEHPATTFVLSGLSKIAGLPQMKAAWIVALGPERERAEALGRLEIVADTFLSMNAPVQLAMPSWLAGRAAIQTQILQRARGNLATLRRIGEQEPERLQLLPVDAGWCAVLGLPGCVGESECAERLARERGVIVHPGWFYGMAETNRVVVSLIGPVDQFNAGIRRAIE